tara:strand:- start:438 stop:824 length:387 start_codon:yes stop_codon:yes gene_type:complete
MESDRQRKVSVVLKKDLCSILQQNLRNYNITNVVVSVTKISISPDLMHAKVFVSIFPFAKSDSILKLIISNKNKIKNSLGKLLRNQIRKIPDVIFFIDDSLDHIDKIDEALRNKSNPIKSEIYKKNKK